MKGKRDISSLIVASFVTYVARELGTVEFGKSFDETLFSAVVPVLFKKGNPLLDTFSNILIEAVWKAVCWKDTGQNCIIEFL